jgi:hypothetical protein
VAYPALPPPTQWKSATSGLAKLSRHRDGKAAPAA